MMKSRKTRTVQHALLRCRGKLHVQCHKRGSGERICDELAAIVAGIPWRFATDYNLVAEIWHGEHRQWTESASCIVL